MDWIVSLSLILAWWLMGRKSRWGPIMGLWSNVAIVVYAIQIQGWGLLLSCVVIGAIQLQTAIKWWKETE